MSTSTSNSILVLGAGELGMAVLRSLSSLAPAHTPLTVLLRPPSPTPTSPRKSRDTAELRTLGISILWGDLTAPSPDLVALFKPFDTVIGCSGYASDSSSRIQYKIASAVLEAGVKRYFPWQFGVDYDVIGSGSAQPLFDEQVAVRALLRAQSRTEWVVVSTGMFTSFLFEPWFGVVDLACGAVHALGSWDNEVTVTSVDDIGAVTAEIVFKDPRVVNEVVYVAGDTITYARLADIVDSVLGRRVERVEWDVRKLEDELAEEPEDVVKRYRVVFAQGKGVSWDKRGTFNAQRGIRVVDVEQWAVANLK